MFFQTLEAAKARLHKFEYVEAIHMLNLMSHPSVKAATPDLLRTSQYLRMYLTNLPLETGGGCV
jgi:hypothetical protein